MDRQDREHAARAARAKADRRAAIGEATGILLAQGDDHARATLREPHGPAGEDDEAARVVATANAAAEDGADPDWI
ncbi:hypothetical protein [Amycolatopsis rifamycinica]|uniref:Uncharacterized protein n=1 Tax=Amycolatopsis rifamycinica TaxID=287986 RepID=A0A066U443_9PSEU|nr:hypothetical protein [Amycolatopsis rifamycinica]KDN21870.1 hypothetical protein DV20_13185 [Amycolatopsis rifamycinica]